MAFKDNIKTLKKEYYNILKKYYNTSNLILKMVALHNKSALSEVDLNFRTCEVYYFTDKNINKLLDKDIAKAIQNLRSRAICCIYTARSIEDMLMNNVDVSERYAKLVQDTKAIINRLYELATTSINLSNTLAKENKLPLLFADGNIGIQDFKQIVPNYMQK